MCEHELNFDKLTLRDRRGLEDDTGLPRQVSGEAPCTNCGEKVTVDYNLAFVNGEKA